MKSVLILLLFSLPLLISCEKSNSDNSPDGLSQFILFQYDHRNLAWGYAHHGWYIDSLGNVTGYNLPDNWNEVDSLGFIAEADLLSNFDKADTVLFQIDKPELLEKIKLFEDIDENKLSEKVIRAADAGGSILYCYIRDNDKGKFKRIFLALSGDWEQHSTDPHAIELTNWLIEIGKDTGQFFWLEL